MIGQGSCMEELVGVALSHDLIPACSVIVFSLFLSLCRRASQSIIEYVVCAALLQTRKTVTPTDSVFDCDPVVRCNFDEYAHSEPRTTTILGL